MLLRSTRQLGAQPLLTKRKRNDEDKSDSASESSLENYELSSVNHSIRETSRKMTN